MASFAAAHANDLPANELVDACVEQLRGTGATGHRLGFVYLTDEVSGQADAIVADLKAKTGVETWLGTIGLGICAGGVEYFSRPAISVLTCDFDAASMKLLPQLNSTGDLDDFPVENFFAAIGIVHADPR
ncbi:MAG: histidine kinase, partial [Pseudomonadota bacterium]